MSEPVRSFGFLLIPGFSLVALSCAIDVLRAANIEAPAAQFKWALLGDGQTSVASSSGIELPCMKLHEAGQFEAVAVCGGERSHLFKSDEIESWLKDQARKGMLVGSLSDGAYVVAAAGLFAKSRSTIHWKCQSAYRERFPNLDIRMSILEIDGNRFSCAGGTASLDLMLHFASRVVGGQTVGRIADNYFHDVIRGDDQVQHNISALRFAARNTKLSEALLIMEAELENPVPIFEIAERLDISHRQLDRLFRRHLGTSPTHHYLEMRLLRASGLLKQSELSVGEIAVGCGFQSASHLGRHFKQRYGQTPGKFRFG